MTIILSSKTYASLLRAAYYSVEALPEEEQERVEKLFKSDSAYLLRKAAQ